MSHIVDVDAFDDWRADRVRSELAHELGASECWMNARRLPDVDKPGEGNMWRKSHVQRAYARDLPGGGFVAIDVTSATSLIRGRRYQGTLTVERRASWRREGHAPPVIAKASGSSLESVVRQLLPAAQYNPAIGAALLHR
jgi:hypothetical protein